jgi:hypothetical protein
VGSESPSPISGSHVLRLAWVCFFWTRNPDAEKRKGVRVIVFLSTLDFWTTGFGESEKDPRGEGKMVPRRFMLITAGFLLATFAVYQFSPVGSPFFRGLLAEGRRGIGKRKMD